MRGMLLWAMLATCSVSAQNNWMDAGMPYHSVGIRQLYVDTAQDRLLAVGQIALSTDFALTVIAAYGPSGWSPITGIEYGGIYTVIRYGDTLLVGGYFHQIDGIPIDLVGAWYDSTWHAFGGFPTGDGVVRKLRLVDDTLYAVGVFLTVDGDTCHGVAKRVGGHWENLGSIDYYPGAEPIILDLCEYQGNIIVGGEINPIGMGSDVIQYDGSSWSAVGGGILGGIGSVAALQVYHNELYVGGGISIQDGNAGHGLMRWDGSVWHDVGGSMRDIYGTTNNNASAGSFLVHDDKLLVGGAFGYAGTLHANQFAVWDGQRWCATGDSIGGNVESMVFYHDTLFIACTNTLDGQPANYVGRWIGGAFEQNCEQVGIAEQGKKPGSFTIGPAEGGQRNLYGLPDGHFSVAVFDAMGRKVSLQRVNAAGGQAWLKDLPNTEGLYIVRAQGKNYVGTARFIVTG